MNSFHKMALQYTFTEITGKVALMSFIGVLNFYTKLIEKLHINLKPFYDLLHENTSWKWTDEHETLFQKLKTSLTSETELTIPITKHPFFITVDASLIGLGTIKGRKYNESYILQLWYIEPTRTKTFYTRSRISWYSTRSSTI